MDALAQLLREKNQLVMGVLNITPDSFSDGGNYLAADAAARQLHALFAAGADIVDIGGESTGPKSSPLSAATEQERIAPIFVKPCPTAILSVDTYHASTARFALAHGAQLINDISALRADPEMAAVVAEHNCFIALMHCKDGPLPHVTNTTPRYPDIIDAISAFFDERLHVATQAGIQESRIILDPGMGGFLSPDPAVSWELLLRLSELVRRFEKFPLLIGTSRKGFLGGPLESRDPASTLTSRWALAHGARIVRVHNVLQFASMQLCKLK